MVDLRSRWKNATDRGRWTAGGASFVAKAKATKAVWFPPKVDRTAKKAASTAKRATKKSARPGKKVGKKATGSGRRTTKKAAGAAKKSTRRS
jgi:hypothetical protein